MGAFGLYRLQRPRVPLLHPNIGASWELPLVPHQGSRYQTLISRRRGHFRAILGPWTWKLRNYFDPCNYNLEDQPKILLEGPFGGGNQDWYKFEVAVMVGGGIGVTPYASILNDLVFGTSTNRYSGVACKKASTRLPKTYWTFSSVIE